VRGTAAFFKHVVATPQEYVSAELNHLLLLHVLRKVELLKARAHDSFWNVVQRDTVEQVTNKAPSAEVVPSPRLLNEFGVVAELHSALAGEPGDRGECLNLLLPPGLLGSGRYTSYAQNPSIAVWC
jgi:hypothetical protein